MMKNLGILLTGVWLVLTGLISLIGLNFAYLGEIMAILAMVAGVFLIIRR